MLKELFKNRAFVEGQIIVGISGLGGLLFGIACTVAVYETLKGRK
jgi:hypothetical protein